MIDLFIFVLQFIIFFLIPGLFLTAALLKGVNLSLFDKAVAALIVALVLNPVMSVTEFTLLGLKLSPSLILANALVILFAGIIGLYLQGFKFNRESLPKMPELSPKSFSAKENIARVLLLIIILVAFWVRFAPAWSTSFQEIDPIYYDHVTDLLVRNGAVPVTSFEVYYPLEKTYRVYPEAIYMTASWYDMYRMISGEALDKFGVMLTSQIYPPLVGALMCFLAFALVREEYGDFMGVIAAGMFAFMPQMVTKFGAGVNELQPFGLFAALLLMTVYWLANKRKSLRLGLLAVLVAIVNVLGSAQAIWPLLVVALFLFMHSFLAFWRDEFDDRTAMIDVGVVAGSIVGYFILNTYTTTGFTLNSQLLLLVIAILPALYFTVVRHVLGKGHANAEGNLPYDFKAKAIGALFVIGLAATILFSGLRDRVFSYVNGTAGFAEATSALTKTVAEEGATNSGYFKGAFAYLDPMVLLPVFTLLLIALSVYALYLSKRKTAAGIVALIAVLAVVFNNQVDAVLLWLVSNPAFGQLQLLTKFIANSDVFVYLIIALIALAAEYILSRQKVSYGPLLFALIILPVSYIGLNKTKYILHLGFALALALPVILGLVLEFGRKFSETLEKQEDRVMASKAVLAIVFIAGLAVVFAQASTVDGPASPIAMLQASRINGDWLATYEWMRTTPTMSDEACIKEYGYKCRVLSWWDYGHWTVFFGEKQSVTDPGNEHATMNQEVARAFVHENPENLKFTATYHQATHILVDNELIPKWGALVFLSGTCAKASSPTCPETPDANWTLGPGASQYEAEHYFEYLTITGNCPKTAVPVDLPMARSSITGASYCLANDKLLLLKSQTELDPNYNRQFLLMGRDAFDPNNLPQNSSFLVSIGGNQLLNLNPDLSYAGIGSPFTSKVFKAAYTKLFFFGPITGTELAYTSPNGMMRVYKILPSFYLNSQRMTQILAGNYNPNDTGTPTPAATATPTPTPTNTTATPTPTNTTITTPTPGPANATTVNTTNATNASG